MEKQCRAGEGTYGLRIACWVPKAIDSHQEYVILMLFHCSSGSTIASQFYNVCKLPVLFIFHSVFQTTSNFQVHSLTHLFRISDVLLWLLFQVFRIQTVVFIDFLIRRKLNELAQIQIVTSTNITYSLNLNSCNYLKNTSIQYDVVSGMAILAHSSICSVLSRCLEVSMTCLIQHPYPKLITKTAYIR